MQRVIEIEKFEVEEEFESSLRPTKFSEFIGQEKLKKNLLVFIKASKIRGENLDHCLFYGPPGLGKTTLANVIANELGVNLKITSAPMIEKSGDLAAILTNLEENDVLFIDEIHRLSPSIEEVLYSAMEDFKLDIIIGSGAGAQSVKVDIAKFTLISATTKAGSISAPLRDRFGMSFRLNFYTPKELMKIIKLASNKLNKKISEDGAKEIAKRSRGTPRIALRLLKRVRDFADFYNEVEINLDRAKKSLEALGVDESGFDEIDLKYLEILKNSKKALGLSTISAMLSEDEGTIEDVIEPYLIANGFVQKTPKGRIYFNKDIDENK